MVEYGIDDPDKSPSFTRRLGLWIFLGLVSTGFAEVLFPNTPFDPTSIFLILVPIYLLHSVFFAGVVFNTDCVTYSSLYLGGVLFGLYESYITKVVWNPVGDPIPFQLGGVYWFETLILILFWHPIVAFVIPVMVVEALATDSGNSLPRFSENRYLPYIVVVITICLAIFQGTLGRGASPTFLMNAVTLLVLLGFLILWRQTDGHRFSMKSLLPSGRELWVFGAALFVLYLLLGATLRVESLPRVPQPHLVVLSIYAVFGGLFFMTLRHREDRNKSLSVEFSWIHIVGLTGLFVFTSFISGLVLTPYKDPVFVSYFVVGLIIGTTSLAYVILSYLR